MGTLQHAAVVEGRLTVAFDDGTTSAVPVCSVAVPATSLAWSRA